MDVSTINWEKVRIIGKGGSSNVYQCKVIRDHDLIDQGEYIAVKEIQTDGLTKEQVTGLRGEVDTIRNLSHPNIIDYMGTQTVSNMFYILLEFADRGSIRHYYQQHGALTPQQASNCTFNSC